MANKSELDFQNIFYDFGQDLQELENTESNTILNIVDFVLKEVDLGEGFKLTDGQMLILKLLYGVDLTEKDFTLLDYWRTVDKTTWNRKKVPSPQVLVLEAGRRSGKSSLASIIAAYEFYCLCKNPNPQEYYKIATSTPIGILVLATTATQAKTAIFRQISMLIKNMRFFKSLIAKGKLFIGKEEIAYEEKGLYIQSGNSKSASQVGGTLKCLIMDEVARFTSNEGDANALSLWSNLGISCAPFKQHAKRVAISSAWQEGDAIEKLYETTSASPFSIGFRMKSWELNTTISRENEIVAYEYAQNPIQAALEFEGIRPAVQNSFFEAKLIDNAVRGESVITAVSEERDGLIYLDMYYCEERAEFDNVIHVDPAVKGDSYALALGHSETDGKHLTVYIDALLLWEPKFDTEVAMSDVGDKIREINQYRPLKSVTADHYNSAETIQRLKQDGIKAEVVYFSNKNQLMMYSATRSLMAEGRLILPTDSIWTPVAIRELKRVQLVNNKKIDHPVGQGESKDLADAICAVTYKLTELAQATGKFSSSPLRNTNPINYSQPANDSGLILNRLGVPMSQTNREKILRKVGSRRRWIRDNLSR